MKAKKHSLFSGIWFLIKMFWKYEKAALFYLVLNPFIVLIFIALVLVNTAFNSRIKKQNNQYNLESSEIDRREGYLESFFYEHRFAKEIRVNTLGKWLEKNMIYCFCIENQQKFSNNSWFLLIFFL
ncbi:hypothetical protein FACS189461_5030 [Spirochaetia bacterium]|nr:hypothetical protein FACS189461_5030 [Spirochaetia bacterium]